MSLLFILELEMLIPICNRTVHFVRDIVKPRDAVLNFLSRAQWVNHKIFSPPGSETSKQFFDDLHSDISILLVIVLKAELVLGKNVLNRPDYLLSFLAQVVFSLGLLRLDLQFQIVIAV